MLIRCFQISFQASCTYIFPHAHQEFIKVLTAPHYPPYLLFSEFYVFTNKTDMKWDVTVVLISVFLVASEKKHLLNGQ